MTTVDIAVDGMHCNACRTRVEEFLSVHPAVLGATVILESGRARVVYDASSAGIDDLCAVVAEAGYSAAPVAPGG